VDCDESSLRRGSGGVSLMAHPADARGSAVAALASRGRGSDALTWFASPGALPLCTSSNSFCTTAAQRGTSSQRPPGRASAANPRF